MAEDMEIAPPPWMAEKVLTPPSWKVLAPPSWSEAEVEGLVLGVEKDKTGPYFFGFSLKTGEKY